MQEENNFFMDERKGRRCKKQGTRDKNRKIMMGADKRGFQITSGGQDARKDEIKDGA